MLVSTILTGCPILLRYLRPKNSRIVTALFFSTADELLTGKVMIFFLFNVYYWICISIHTCRKIRDRLRFKMSFLSLFLLYKTKQKNKIENLSFIINEIGLLVSFCVLFTLRRLTQIILFNFYNYWDCKRNIYYILSLGLVGFYGISTFIGYLTPDSVICIYIRPKISKRILSR